MVLHRKILDQMWFYEEFEMTGTIPRTMSVPEAGRIYYGLSRGGSYDAAMRGDIPTIRVGRLLRVPVQAMERRLAAADHGEDNRAA